MTLKKVFSITIILTLILAAMPASPVQAAKGMPGSGQFGVGAHISLNGPNLNRALEFASELSLDWIMVDLSWAEFNPEQNASPDWTRLDQVMNFAGNRQIAVMVSLSQPPTWALTENGPDANLTYQWISTLTNRYPNALKAVEVFAKANTRQGWGTKPSPKAYAKLFTKLHEQVSADGLSISLIAGGLVPVLENDPGKKMNDLKFLQKLYDNGLKDLMPVISIQMPQTTGDPLTAPNGQEYHYLRHYEEIRQVMLDNGHGSGLVWITRLAPPDGSINSADEAHQSPQAAEQWMLQALTQLQAQLYLGVAALNDLNPAENSQSPYLIENSTALINEIAGQIKGQTASNRPLKQGRPKSQIIGKGVPPA